HTVQNLTINTHKNYMLRESWCPHFGFFYKFVFKIIGVATIHTQRPLLKPHSIPTNTRFHPLKFDFKTLNNV
ncbi:unnamed protein product, partial [Prunus brigantina]